MKLQQSKNFLSKSNFSAKKSFSGQVLRRETNVGKGLSRETREIYHKIFEYKMIYLHGLIIL